MSDSDLGVLFRKYCQLAATLRLVDELRDPVLADCPIMVAAAQVRPHLQRFLWQIGEHNADTWSERLKLAWQALVR